MFFFHSSCAHCAVDDSLEFAETATPSFIGELGVSPVLGLDCRQFFSREGGGGGGGGDKVLTGSWIRGCCWKKSWLLQSRRSIGDLVVH